VRTDQARPENEDQHNGAGHGGAMANEAPHRQPELGSRLAWGATGEDVGLGAARCQEK
jgi:hypothetical protein